MIQGRRIAISVFVAFAFAGGVYGDMMPAAAAERVPVTAASPAPPAISESTDEFAWPGGSSMGNPALPSFAATFELPEETSRAESTTQPSHILPQDRGSVDLCLYALLGLGLCRSGQLARKSATGCIPDWYHSGGPCQIGHSNAVGPEPLCPVPVNGFALPNMGADHSWSLPAFGASASLRDASQCTCPCLVSRGPPLERC